MIPLAIPNLDAQVGRYLEQCVTSTFVSSVGPFVSRFETMVATAAGAARAVATASGTAGLHAALVAVGVGRDDLVIMPSFTFIATANAVAYCAADPWLLDIEPAGWGLDPTLLAGTLERETERRGDRLVHRESGRRVAAVLPVHTLGTPADMAPLVATARAFGLPVVADAAAALGATYRDAPVGQLGAELSVFSFNGNKTVTAGSGGAVVGDDPALLDLVRHLTTTARCGEDYDHDRVGFNYRMSNVEAAVGCAQLERLAEFVARKRAIRHAYDAAFADLPGVTPFPVPAGVESACWFSGVVLDQRSAEACRAVRATLRERGIDARPFWKPVHLQRPFAHAPRTPQPVSERLWARVLTLPCSTGLTAAEQATVIAAVRQVLA